MVFAADAQQLETAPKSASLTDHQTLNYIKINRFRQLDKMPIVAELYQVIVIMRRAITS